MGLHVGSEGVDPSSAFNERKAHPRICAAQKKCCTEVGYAVTSGNDHKGIGIVVPNLKVRLSLVEPDIARVVGCDAQDRIGVKFDLVAICQGDGLVATCRRRIGLRHYTPGQGLCSNDSDHSCERCGRADRKDPPVDMAWNYFGRKLFGSAQNL